MGAQHYCYICGGPMEDGQIITDIPLLTTIVDRLTPEARNQVLYTEDGENIIEFLSDDEEIITKKEKEQLTQSLLELSEDSKYGWLVQCLLLNSKNKLMEVSPESAWDGLFKSKSGKSYDASFYLTRNIRDEMSVFKSKTSLDEFYDPCSSSFDDGYVMHNCCYKIATMKYGQFKLKDLSFGILDHGLIKEYQWQDVPFPKYFIENNDWMLESPMMNMKNRRRIFELTHPIRNIPGISKTANLSALKIEPKRDENEDKDQNAKNYKLATQILVKSKSLSKYLNKYDIDFEEVVKLINKGADVNTKNVFNKTALHFAAQEGKIEYVKHLIENGADINARDDEGRTPLFYAKENLHTQVEQYLKENQADLNTEIKGYIVVNEPKRYLQEQIEQNKNKLFNCLNKNNCHEAVKLIQNGGSAETRSWSGKTALHLATIEGHKEYISYLLENGAKINSKDDQDKTALHYASIYGHMELVSYLLEKGVDLNARDELGQSALHFAIMYDYPKISLHLLKNGADINAADIQNRTALHKASLGGYLEFVTYLFEMGVDLNGRDLYGRTALHDAAFCGHLEVAKYLLKHGADVEAKDIHGRTPLHYATTLPSAELAQYLLENGSDPLVKDNEGLNAMEYGQWFI